MSLTRGIRWLDELIQFPSVSSTSNADVSDWIVRCLVDLGFQVERTSYTDTSGVPKVNLVGWRYPTTGDSHENGVAYFCHTDVVPASGWTGPGGDPFRAVVTDESIFGRGSCDMKGSLTAMLSAVANCPPQSQRSPIWVVCTADEEVGFQGAKHLVAHSTAYRELVAAQPLAIIGEPTSLRVVHAHKGIHGFRLVSRGKAAHSSTNDGMNANEAMVPMLQTLLEICRQTREDESYWDARFDPPTLSWNFGFSDGNGAVNVTPERSEAWVTLRSMPNIDGRDLVDRVRDQAGSLNLEFIEFEGGDPFWVDPQSDFVCELSELVGAPSQTVCYGTDGGEFSELRKRVVLGPGDIAQAHTTDEYLELEQLQRGIDLYSAILEKWCC